MKGLFLAIILASISQLCYGIEDPCSTAKCDNITVLEVLKHLWSATTNISSLGEEYQNNIIWQAENGLLNDLELFVLTTQTALAAHIYSDFQHPYLSSLNVLEDVLSLRLNSSISDAQYNKALTNFGNFLSKAAEFTTDMCLKAAGCPVNNPNKSPPIESLSSGNVVKKFLKTKNSSKPVDMIIEQLSNSNDSRDLTVAVIPAMLSGGPIVELCSQVRKTDDLMNVWRLIACDIKIPQDCCKSRKQEIEKRVKIAAPIILDNLMRLLK